MREDAPEGVGVAVPKCGCHGIPMYWHKYNDGRPNGGIWRCREKRRALDAKRWDAYYYERLTAADRARLGLASRRRKALERRRERQQRRAES